MSWLDLLGGIALGLIFVGLPVVCLFWANGIL